MMHLVVPLLPPSQTLQRTRPQSPISRDPHRPLQGVLPSWRALPVRWQRADRSAPCAADDQIAAKFVDNEWYRARVERVAQGQVSVIYIDYGNRATIPLTDCAALPGMFAAAPRYAKEYCIACVKMPKDVSAGGRLADTLHRVSGVVCARNDGLLVC